jgi:hypothetical protein
MISRRAFLGTVAGGLLAAPLAAEAQPAGKVYRIGALTLNVIDPSSPGVFEGFLRGLRERGWLVGQNVTISGATPSLALLPAKNHSPVRPTPVCTSS